MAFSFSKRSLEKLDRVHPDLVKIAKLAIRRSEVDFGITEGARTLARQKKLFEAGATRTMNSRHLTDATGLCYALDVVAYIGRRVSWDWPLYSKIASAMKDAAEDSGLPLEWGGDWRSFKDGPHFQLPHKTHPKKEFLS